MRMALHDVALRDAAPYLNGCSTKRQLSQATAIEAATAAATSMGERARSSQSTGSTRSGQCHR